MDDMELLREYAASKSEQAFAAVVARHINLVYSVALRHAGNAYEAQDITQSVFIVLAKKAGSLRQGTVLSGWLFHAARMTASNFLRTEARRMRREQEAYMRSTLNETENGDAWTRVAPLLDMAIGDLGEKDRNAIVLRYVEGKDLKEVGQALGATEDAAKKRVSRAVEKLRGFFTKRGIALSSTALAGAISANAVEAAPAGLAAVITAGAIQGAGTTVTSWALTKGALKLMAWTKVKIAVGVGVAALVAYQWHQNDVQTKQIAALQQELKDAGDKTAKQQASIDQLKQEKLAMVEEKSQAQKASARLLAHQRTAFDAKTAAAAKNAAKGASAGAAISKILDDPAMKEMMHEQQVSILRKQYAPLIKSLNLSPDAADQFVKLLADNTAKQMERGIAFMKGELDEASGKQAMVDQSNQLIAQLQSLLGADGYAQYKQFSTDLPAKTTLGFITDKMEDTPMTKDQSDRLFALLKAAPEKPDLTLGNATGADMEKYLQREMDNNQRILQGAAEFLSQEQLANLAAYQTNMINMTRVGMNMKQKFLSGN